MIELVGLKGFIIKPHWGDKILSGEKTWEIRSKSTQHRGHTEIIYSGTQKRYGSADLINCIYIPRSEFDLHFDKHRVDQKYFDISSYKELYAWVFANPKKHEVPIPYVRKPGEVVWVNL